MKQITTFFLFVFSIWYGFSQENGTVFEMVLQRGHSFDISSIAFHPENKMLATGGYDNNIILWTTPDGKIIRVLKGHTKPISSVVFDKDGSHLLSASRDGTVNYWDTSGNLLLSINAHPGSAQYAYFCDNNNAIMSFGNRSSTVYGVSGGEIKRWSLKGEILSFHALGGDMNFSGVISENKTVMTLKGSKGDFLYFPDKNEFKSYTYGFSFHSIDPSGTYTGCITEEDAFPVIKIKTVDNDKMVKEIRSDQYRFLSFCFMHNSGNLIILAEKNKAVCILEYHMKDDVFTVLEEYDESFFTWVIALSPDDEFLAFNNAQGLIIYSFKNHLSTIVSDDLIANSRIAVSPDNNYIAHYKSSYPKKDTISLWHMSGTLKTVIHVGDQGDSLFFSTDSRYMKLQLPGAEKIWKIDGTPYEPGKDEKEPEFFENTGYNIRTTPDNRYEIETEREYFTIRGKGHSFHKQVKAFEDGTVFTAVSPDSNYIAAYILSSMEEKYRINTLKLYTIQGDLIASYFGGFIRSVDIDPNKKRLAAGSEDNSIRVWDFEGRLITRLKGHSGVVTDVFFLKDGEFLISTSLDGSIILWNMSDFSSLALIEEAGQWVMYTDKGYFDCSYNGSNLVGMTTGEISYGVDQFAVLKNRPDIILDNFFSVSAEEKNTYVKQYIKRLARLDLLPSRIETEQINNTILPSITNKETAALLQSAYKDGILKKSLSYREKIMLLSEPSFLKATTSFLEKGYTMPHAVIKKTDRQGKYATLTIDFSDESSTLLHYNIYVNNVPSYGYEGKPLKRNHQTMIEKIELSPGRNKIEVSCVNRNYYESYRDVIYQEYREKIKGDLYYLGFGVSQYRNKEFNLLYPEKDVRDLESAFLRFRQEYKNIHTHTFTNDDCTAENIRNAKELLKNAKVDDTVILFISGHGIHDSDPEGTYYFLTSEADAFNLKETAANYDSIENILDGIAPRKKLFFMDTCESGELDEEVVAECFAAASSRGFKARTTRGLRLITAKNKKPRDYLLDRNRYIYNDLLRRTGAMVFSSSRGGELSYEPAYYFEEGNGFFTGALIKTFRYLDSDINTDGYVSAFEIRQYVHSLVSEKTNGLQNPVVDRDNTFQSYLFPLIDPEINTDMSDERKLQILFKAIQNNNPETAKKILELGVDINARDENGITLLIAATESGNQDIVKLLLTKGANLNDTVSSNGFTALMYAVGKGNYDMVKLFVDNGADVHIVSRYNQTALSLAMEKKYLDIADLLIAAGAGTQ